MTTLIDDLHEATVTAPAGLAYVTDLYALRTIIRKAQCFTIGADSSALIADFSVAIAHNIDDVRQLAIPPYPVTWFDIDNVARLSRIRDLGIKMTQNAEFDPVKRVGWLIDRHPSQHTTYRATYVTKVEKGIITSPLAFGWDIAGNDCPWSHPGQLDYSPMPEECSLLFGIQGLAPVPSTWLTALPGAADFRIYKKGFVRRHAAELMVELSGELRSIFGLLLALGTSPPLEGAPYVGGETRTISGKQLLPREHRVLTISLRRKETAPEAVRRAVAAHRKRRHDVRGHLRTYRNEDGSVKRIVPISAHKRGDEKLGVITKTYEVRR